MPCAFLDDEYHGNPKIISAGNEAAGVYSRALSYCAAFSTDGFVSAAWALQAVAGKQAVLDRLTRATLWEPVSGGDAAEITDRADNEITVEFHENGFFILDYTLYNFSSVEIADRRKKRSDAGRKGALIKWQNAGKHPGKPSSKRLASARQEPEQTPSKRSGKQMTPARTRAHTRAPGPSPLTPQTEEHLERDVSVGPNVTGDNGRQVKPPDLKTVDQQIGGAA